MQPNHVTSRVQHAFTVAVLLLAFAKATAQTTPTPTPTSSKDDDVITLDAFTVTSEKAVGYRAANSITATGIGAAIGDTPLTINVVTKDFLTDTHSDLLIDALRFVPGVSSSPTNESQPFVRGFQGTFSLRNGVFRRQNLTTWNVERVEVIQGPASIFYSNVRPGGMINYITTKPELGKTFADVSVGVGNEDYYRAEGAFNVALGDKGALRAVIGKSSNGSYLENFDERQRFLSLAAVWQLTPNHKVTVEATDEYTDRENSWSAYDHWDWTNSRYYGNPAAIASGQSVSAWMAANYPGVPVYDEHAPFEPAPGDTYGRTTNIVDNTFQDTINRTVDFEYDGKLTDQLAVSVIANRAYEKNQGINPALGDIYADGTFRDVRFDWFINIRDSYNLNTKIVYRLNFAGMKHSLMVGNDNQWVTQRYPLFNGSGNLAGPVHPGVYDPKVSHIDARVDYATPSNSRNTIRKREEFFGGNYFVDQVSMFNDRLFLLGGMRRVSYWQTLKYIPTASGATFPPVPPKYTIKEWTPQFGGLFKIGKGLSAFASFSKSIEPQLGIDVTGQTVQPIKGKGFDTGVKLDMLGGALTGTVDYFEVKRDNVAIYDSARSTAAGYAQPIGYWLFGNGQKTRGLQVDTSWSVSRDFQLVASWNHFLEADNVAPQSDVRQIGRQIADVPDDTVTLWAKYQPLDGALKGFTFGGGPRYTSEMVIGGDFNSSTMKIPAVTVLDLMVGYRAKVFARNVDFRLNVKNVFDKIYREGGSSFAGDRSFVLTASTRF